jgi:hypothetical protein
MSPVNCVTNGPFSSCDYCNKRTWLFGIFKHGCIYIYIYIFHVVSFLLCLRNFHTSRHQIACFRVTAKSYNVATRTMERRRVKTAQNSQQSKASNAVLFT